MGHKVAVAASCNATVTARGHPRLASCRRLGDEAAEQIVAVSLRVLQTVE